MFNPDKYLSVTWRMGGRLYPELDCYGVVHEVRRDLGLPVWPAFEGVIKDGNSMDLACRKFMCNVSKCAAQNGAVAACYEGGLVAHVAIVVLIDGALYVIESNPTKNVTILPLRRFERRFVKVEYYQ